MSTSSSVEVRILQGQDAPYPHADINIVIDVIRAFTVSQIAFSKGVREIFLVNTVAEAMALREAQPGLLLAGEIDGLPIDGFDLDNSPYTFSKAELTGRTMVQKTTNGVKATLLALNAPVILVTGFSNAKTTALHARKLAQEKAGQPGRENKTCTVNVIASHPEDDDDLACAQYIRDILLGENAVQLADVQRRIQQSSPAEKFLDPAQPEYQTEDIPFCTQEVNVDFVMEVDASLPLPKIVRRMTLI